MALMRSEAVCRSLALPTADLIQFAPFLYQDFTEITTNTDAMVSLLNNHVPDMKDRRVLDLCCAKGASLLRVAKRFGCSGVGVDLSELFVSDANLIAKQLKLSDQVEFVVGDLRDYLKQNHEDYDLIIIPFIDGLLGNFRETLDLLASHLSARGMLLIDTLYEATGQMGVAATTLSGEKTFELHIAESDFATKGRHGEVRQDIAKRMALEYQSLSKRTHELQQQQPQLDTELKQFLLKHRELAQDLASGNWQHATWLLSKL